MENQTMYDCTPIGELPPKVSVSRLVNSLKGVSARGLRQEYPELRQHYTIGAQMSSGLAPTLLVLLAGRRFRYYANTSSNKIDLMSN